MSRIIDSESVFPASEETGPSQFSREFLQTVMDALPEAVVVIDRSHNIVMSNRAAQVHKACLKCYQCYHGQAGPCSDAECPVKMVVETKAPVRVYHTHVNAEQREVSVAIDAAPILDESGEVIYMVEACRDVTERTLSRRLSRIGNRHMAMDALLSEYASEIRGYTHCSQVHIHVLDQRCSFCGCAGGNENPEIHGSESRQAATELDCICVRQLGMELVRSMPPATDAGSYRFSHFSAFLSGLPEANGSRLGSCVRRDCESVALIRIQHADHDIGLLHVADPRPDTISPEMVASLERLSSELGAAIHRVHIEDALQAVRGELEVRVRERTVELTKANESLQREIVERGRLERKLLRATVKEQQRIGQELHDGLGQELTGINYMVQNLVMSLKRQGSPDAENAEELARSVRAVIGQTQTIVRGLVPLEIGMTDLEPALEDLTRSVAKQTGLLCEFHSNDVAQFALDDTDAMQIYRIAQEAITNAVKHSQARSVQVALHANADAIRLEVFDDGVGIGSNAGDGPGCGLRSMRHRARSIGGDLEVTQRSEGGTSVTCHVVRRPLSSTRVRNHRHDV